MECGGRVVRDRQVDPETDGKSSQCVFVGRDDVDTLLVVGIIVNIAKVDSDSVSKCVGRYGIASNSNVMSSVDASAS